MREIKSMYCHIYEFEDGKLKITTEDFFVGGGSYETIYTLDKENKDKLAALLAHHEGTLEEKIRAEFGKCLEKHSFIEFCKQHDIRYELFTWIDEDWD